MVNVPPSTVSVFSFAFASAFAAAALYQFAVAEAAMKRSTSPFIFFRKTSFFSAVALTVVLVKRESDPEDTTPPVTLPSFKKPRSRRTVFSRTIPSTFSMSEITLASAPVTCCHSPPVPVTLFLSRFACRRSFSFHACADPSANEKQSIFTPIASTAEPPSSIVTTLSVAFTVWDTPALDITRCSIRAPMARTTFPFEPMETALPVASVHRSRPYLLFPSMDAPHKSNTLPLSRSALFPFATICTLPLATNFCGFASASLAFFLGVTQR